MLRAAVGVNDSFTAGKLLADKHADHLGAARLLPILLESAQPLLSLQTLVKHFEQELSALGAKHKELRLLLALLLMKDGRGDARDPRIAISTRSSEVGLLLVGGRLIPRLNLHHAFKIVIVISFLIEGVFV